MKRKFLFILLTCMVTSAMLAGCSTNKNELTDTVAKTAIVDEGEATAEGQEATEGINETEVITDGITENDEEIIEQDGDGITEETEITEDNLSVSTENSVDVPIADTNTPVEEEVAPIHEMEQLVGGSATIHFDGIEGEYESLKIIVGGDNSNITFPGAPDHTDDSEFLGWFNLYDEKVTEENWQDAFGKGGLVSGANSVLYPKFREIKEGY